MRVDRKNLFLTAGLIVLGIATAFLLTKFQPETEIDKTLTGAPRYGYSNVITPTAPPETPSCSADKWECAGWSGCSASGKQTRTCTKTFECGSADTPSPATTQSCTPPPPPRSCDADIWECGAWTACSDAGKQTRTCRIIDDCPSANTPSPATSQNCTPPVKETPVSPPQESQPAEPEHEAAEEPKSQTAQVAKTIQEDFKAVLAETFPEEKIETLTNSPICDSDHDGICDAEEKKLGTDPLLYDTDRDGLNDFMDPNPLIPEQACPDANKNGVCDDKEKRIEEASGVSLLESGQRDSDGDGLSDLIEARIGTDIKNADTDFDGKKDGEEYLLLASNPKKSDQVENIAPVITNIRSGELVSSNFTISGTAPSNELIDVWVLYKDGTRLKLGVTASLDNGKFLFSNTKNLAAGQFLLYVESSGTPPPCGFPGQTGQANILGGSCPEELQTSALIAQKGVKRALSDDTTRRSQVVLIEVSEAPPIKAPDPKKLSDAEISKEVLLKNLQVTINEDTPILSGITELGTTVIANWTSALLSSAIIADLEGGAFEIKAPSALLPGDHRVLVYAKQQENGTVSPSVAVSFKISEQGEVSDQKTEIVSPTIPTEKSLPWLPIGVGVAGVIIGALIAMLLRKKHS